MFSGIVGAALKAFFGALLSNIFGFLQRKSDDAAREQLGAEKAAAAINKGSADATRRAAAAAANAPDVRGTLDDMRGGKF